LQNRLVSFRFAISFYKTFSFTLEATLSIVLIIQIQFEDVSNQKNQKHRAISDTTSLRQHRSAICDPLCKRKWFKHRMFDEPFEIKAHDPCSLESEDHKTILAQEKIQSQIVKMKMSLFEATKKR